MPSNSTPNLVHTCRRCGKIITTRKPYDTATRIYCSKSCYFAARREGPVGPHASKRKPVADRFWSKVDQSGGPDACWPYLEHTNRAGYGKFTIGVNKKAVASRMAWVLTHGDPASDLFVLHRCDNPPCCNPAHLFLGTKGDNARDCVRKGRRGRMKES